MKKYGFLTTLTALLLGSLSFGQITASEKQAIKDALFLGNMTLKDLEWERKPFDDPYRLPIVNLCLDKPLEAADALMAIHAKADQSVPSLLRTAMKDLLADPEAPPPALPGLPEIKLPPELPAAYQGAVRALVAAIYRANGTIRGAFAQLTSEERRTLVEGLPKWACPEFDYAFVKGPTKDQATLLGLLKKVDLKALRAGAQRLAIDVEGPMAALSQLAVTAPYRGQLTFSAVGVRVEFSGVEDDVHSSSNTQLSIDLGGNDRYTGRYGAGIGYASVLMDLGGDDVYDAPDLSLGAGVTGIGLAYDRGGNDVFRGKSLCFGAGLAGVGVLQKEGGDDTYSGLAMTQGFAQFGIGMCVDTKGNDRYEAALNAQGAASTQGVGWLIDREGDDTYRAGGKILNSPLFADIHYSNAQGFGTGYREDTGGISGGVGLLTDQSGDDAYIAETYAQAASYWFGLGTLYDAKGHDTYRAYHYSQASAMHMCAAYFFDLAGDDSYAVSWGAAFAIGHDYGVAFFLDRSGNDLYASRDSGPGAGNANGLGLFIDGAGDDRYTGPSASGNPARGTGSLGVFVDMNGTDKYVDGLSDGGGRVSGLWGVAYDKESKLSPDMAGAVPPTQRIKPKPNSKPMPDEKAIQELYRRATQWSVGTAAEDTANAIDSLIEIGTQALKWMIDNKLSNASRLEQRAFTEVANGIGADGRLQLATKVGAGDKAIVIPALGVCIDGGFKEAGTFLPKAMQNPDTARLSARAAGTLGGKECVNDLMALCASQDRLTTLNALVSLSQIGDASAYGTAAAFVTSDVLPMRKAALALMAKFPEQALANAKGLLGSSDEGFARTGIELLGLIGTPESLALAGEKLEDARPGVRIQALMALSGRCPVELRQKLLALRDDSNALVRAMAQKVDVGR